MTEDLILIVKPTDNQNTPFEKELYSQKSKCRDKVSCVHPGLWSLNQEIRCGDIITLQTGH